mgnify:CR=1 FL=1
MMTACLVLILAWGIGDVCQSIRTGDFLVHLLGDAIPVAVLPSIIFVLSGAVAFATGTSWGTMAIVYPLALPLAWNSAKVSHLFN